MMPPRGRAAPPDAAAREGARRRRSKTPLDRAAQASPNPGRPLVHRLNRAEYANAIRDLLALDIDAASLLPADDSSAGFDNIADVLGRLAGAARELSLCRRTHQRARGRRPEDAADGRGVPRPPGRLAGSRTSRGCRSARSAALLDSARRCRSTASTSSRSSCSGRTSGRCAGSSIRISSRSASTACACTWPRSAATRRSRRPATTRRTTGDEIDGRFTVRVPLKAGPRDDCGRVPREDARATTRAACSRTSAAPPTRSTSPAIRTSIKFILTGPFNPTGVGDTPSRRRIFVCQPRSGSPRSTAVRATRILSTALARRAYRGDVTDGRPARRCSTSTSAAARRRARFDGGIDLALRRLLASPKFVFRVERDPARRRRRRGVSAGDLELASRLSFFLWSSIPDDELLDVAAQGRSEDAGGARAAGAPDAGRPEVAGARRQLRRPVAAAAQPAEQAARTRTSSPTSTTTCGRRW